MIHEKKKCLLQDASSDPSEQSLLWSHIQPNGIHSPGVVRHVNSSAVHTFVSAIKFFELNEKKCNPKKNEKYIIKISWHALPIILN